MRRLLPVLALASLGPGCATAATLATQALGQGAFGQASPMAPFSPPSERYVPRSPEPAELVVRELAFGRNRVTVLAAVSASGRRALRRARLAPAAAAPCTAGWVAESVWLDQQRRWDRPVGWSGEHELELRFGAPRELLREPLVLDLLLVDGGKDGDGDRDRCLRRRLGGPDAEDGLRRKSRASGGGGFGLMLVASPTSGERDLGRAFQGTGSLGAWFGRWRLGGRLDVCIGGCDRGAIMTFPVAAVVERLLYLGNRFTLAAALGYQPGRVDDLIGLWRGSRTWVHGPRAGLLVLGPRPFAGGESGQGYSSRGLGLFVSRQLHTVYPARADGVSDRGIWMFGVEATTL